MKEIFDGVVGPVKELYDMLPFHDPDKKYQRALEKLKELKKREHEVYAEIGRRVYKENGAEAYPLEVEKLRRIYDERRAAELEVESLAEERRQAESKGENRRCPRCGTINLPEVKFCRECGQKMDEQAELCCGACGGKNPEGTRFCGFCGARMGQPPPDGQEKTP